MTLTVADAAGESWSPVAVLPGFVNFAGARALVADGAVHLVAWNGSSLRYWRAPLDADFAQAESWSAPLALGPPPYGAGLFAEGGALYVTHLAPAGVGRWDRLLQRCPLHADCTRRDSWLPEAIRLGEGLDAGFVGPLGTDLDGLVWKGPTNLVLANGLEDGRRWTVPYDTGVAGLGLAREPLFGEGFIATAGVDSYAARAFDRLPGLTPADVAIDVGADGRADLARVGMPGLPVQLPDFSAALNAYLASSGATSGNVSVPVSVTGAGVGKTVLRNLEVRYRSAADLAGFAEPPLFSPGASPGALDTSKLSMLSSGVVAVMTPAKTVARTLPTVASGGRFVASFDGRDDAGAPLPSGAYLFGAPGWPVGSLEIDDIAPTVALDVRADEAFGGASEIRGTVTDRDFAGAAKNFSRFVLEYSTDGTTYRTIASSTTPVTGGPLARWNTLGLAAGAATLRLTAWDRAGNASSVTTSVRISPDAPHAPVIEAPTSTGTPVDVVAGATTVSGKGDPGTEVTVFVNGGAAGTVPCDGTWTLANVALPVGVSTIDAVSTRGALDGARSAPIVVARYALSVLVEAPERLVAGESTTGAVHLARTSVDPTPLTVRLRAVDTAGHEVPFGFAPSSTTVAFAAAGTTSFTSDVETRGVAPGVYRIVAEVVSGGLVAARAEAPITLDGSIDVQAVVGTDRAIYDALQQVGATLRLANVGAAETGPLSATFAFTGPGGSVDALPALAIASIPPLGSAAVSVLHGAPPLPVGAYRLDVAVADGAGFPVAIASTTFEVQSANGSGALAGSLVVTPGEYVPGDLLAASFSIANRGVTEEIPVSVLLLSQATGAVFARVDRTLSVPAGATFAETVSLPTRGADGDLIALLVGNGRGLAGQAVRLSPWRDTEAPSIAIDGLEDGEHRNAEVIPVVTITDESPFTADVELNGGPFASGTPVTADGTYELVVSATDVYGNAAGPLRRTFTVDRTPPLISIDGVADGDLTNATVWLDVGMADLHLASTSILLDGLTWDGLPVDSAGDHVLEARAADLAGNEATAGPIRFTIDRTPPLITITGVTDGELANHHVQPVVTVSDANGATFEAAVDGVPWHGEPLAQDGRYELAVSAQDSAGNTAQASIRFGVDTTPPRITVSGVSDGLLTRLAVAPVVSIADENPGTQTATIDGRPLVSGQPLEIEGEHRLLVEATDAAGNRAAPVDIRFVQDFTAPTVAISGVSEGAVYLGAVTPSWTASDAHLGSVIAELDGQPFEAGSEVSAPGLHVLAVTASDAAGNVGEAVVRFEIVEVEATLAIGHDRGPRALVWLDGCRGRSSRDRESTALLAALDGAGIPYDVATNASAYLDLLRTQRHNVRILYRLGSSEPDAYEETGELTWSGGGLVVVNQPPADDDPKLADALGVRMGGLTALGKVRLAAGALGPDRTLRLDGKGVVQRLAGATAEATTCDGDVVLSTHAYGDGRAATFTFDPEANADVPGLAEVLVAAVRWAGAAGRPSAVPGAPQFLGIDAGLTSAGSFDFRLVADVPSGLEVVSAPLSLTDDPPTWAFTLAAGEEAHRTLVVRAQEAGTYPVTSSLSFSYAGSSFLAASTSFDVAIPRAIETMLADATFSVAALSDANRGAALSHLAAVTLPPATRKEAERSIRHVLHAAELVASMRDPLAPAARRDVDALLRALELASIALP
jgi:hypothetical protein